MLFVAFWVLLGLGLFFVAVRGGLGGARAALQTQTRGAPQGAGVIFVVLYVGVRGRAAARVPDGNHANASARSAGSS